MKDNPGSGYVVAVPQLVLTFSPEDQAKCNLLIEDGEPEDLCVLLGELLAQKNLPRPVEVFRFSDEDVSDDLECGELYARWDEDDLFYRTDKPGMKALDGLGCRPWLGQWAIWG